jgi:hypothetical protein
MGSEKQSVGFLANTCKNFGSFLAIVEIFALNKTAYIVLSENKGTSR